MPNLFSGRVLAPLIGLALLAVALPLALLSRTADVEPAPSRSKRVVVAEVESRALDRTLRFAGVARAARRAELSFPTGGRLLARPAELGDRLRRGEVVARLDRRKMDNAVDGARAASGEIEARRRQAELERQRVERLAASGAATAEELEQVTAAAEALAAGSEAAEARLREAERMRGDAALVAPFDGVVSEVRLEPGEHAAAGQTVLVISGDGAIEVEIAVPEAVVGRLESGAPARARLPFDDDRTVDGTVRSVARAASGQAGLFPVVVSFGDQAGLAPGATLEVLLDSRGGESVTVPLTAILDPGGGRPSVFRLRGESVEKVAVSVESIAGERVAVSGGLEPGDRVVVAGHGGLLDGDRVEVVR